MYYFLHYSYFFSYTHSFSLYIYLSLPPYISPYLSLSLFHSFSFSLSLSLPLSLSLFLSLSLSIIDFWYTSTELKQSFAMKLNIYEGFRPIQKYYLHQQQIFSYFFKTNNLQTAFIFQNVPYNPIKNISCF